MAGGCRVVMGPSREGTRHESPPYAYSRGVGSAASLAKPQAVCSSVSSQLLELFCLSHRPR